MPQNGSAGRMGQVRIPECSADWRFLLPIDEQSRVLIVTHDCAEFSLSLDALNVQNITWHFKDLAAGIAQDSSFDVLAFPLGIPVDSSSSRDEQIRVLLTRTTKLLKPAGAILFGFANRWGLGNRGPRAKLSYSTQNEMKSLFLDLGFSEVEIYGAFPNLQVPEYIFPPSGADLGFILQRRYKHKVPAAILNLISSPVPSNWLLRHVPFYYMVAYRSGASIHGQIA